MSPESQSIAIAEFCGFVKVRMVAGELMGIPPPCRGWIAVPAYLKDLNAMHQVEKKAPNEYWSELAKVTDSWIHSNISLMIERVAHATAAQRAEALLRTIGKWKD